MEWYGRPYPEQLPEVRIPESERDVRHVKTFRLIYIWIVNDISRQLI